MSTEQDALKAATTDPATGLFNHSYFQYETENTLRRALRFRQSVTVMLLSPNAAAPSDAASIIAGWVGVVRKTLRSTDVIARAGNDEIEVLLPDTPGASAEHVARKLFNAFAQAGLKGAVAIGIATYPDNAPEAHALFSRAREARDSIATRTTSGFARSTFAAPVTVPTWISRQFARGAPEDHDSRPVADESLELIRVPFTAGTQPLKEDEWKSVMGSWQLAGDEWVSTGQNNNVLISKPPVFGSFRFICEAWSEGLAELSILGHAYESSRTAHWGYSVHVGADGNTCTKFARVGTPVLVLQGVTIEPGRHYRFELRYDEADGRVTFLLDNQRLFEYQDKVRIPGHQIGLCAWGAGAHLKPLEVHCRHHHHLTAMSLADEFLQENNFELARQCYSTIDARYPQSLEGAQARLKGAICLARMNNPVQARKELLTLAGTELEPFALAEEGMLNLRNRTPYTMRSGLDILEDLARRFPASQAGNLVLEAVGSSRDRTRYFDVTRVGDLQIRGRLNRLASNTCTPPAYSQIRSAIELARVNWQLGAWKLALEEILSFRPRLHPTQYDVADFRLTLLTTALANGRDDLLPDDPSISQIWESEWAADWCSGIVLHAVVRKGDPAVFLEDYSAAAKEYPEISGMRALQHGVLLLQLAANRLDDAAAMLRSQFLPRVDGDDYFWHYWIGGSLVDARNEALFREFIDRLSAIAGRDGARSNSARVLSLLKARWALAGGDVEAAAQAMEGWPPPELVFHFSEGLVFQALLSSLGLLKTPSKADLETMIETRLGGVELNLAQMFLGLHEAKPNDLWPHPAWRPEFRLWLAQWLMAKGHREAAKSIAEPAIDPRYGATHSQTSLAALLSRAERGTVKA